MIELVRYDGGMGIHQSACREIKFQFLGYDEIHDVVLNEDNCIKFEIHPKHYKVYYKPDGKEQFIAKPQLCFGEEPEIISEVVPR